MFSKILKILLIIGLPICSFANNIEVAWSPNRGSEDLIIKVINSAQKNICMATYSFTSSAIAKAIVAAKKRGVDIKVVSDYKANSDKYTATKYLANQGINVRLNDNYPIMHNKFIVVDNQTVETGSFNYSNAGSYKNAENVIVIWNTKDVANKYQIECNRLFAEASAIKKDY